MATWSINILETDFTTLSEAYCSIGAKRWSHEAEAELSALPWILQMFFKGALKT